MKHNLKITIILLSMFIITQLLGLLVVNFYNNESLPFGIKSPELESEKDFSSIFISVIFAFIVAILIFFVLTKMKLRIVLKLWFFAVVALALGITINFILLKSGVKSLVLVSIISISIAVILSYFKTYKRIFVVHNLTELAIYPGIAAVFVPILNVYTLVILLFLISAYDMWAVWKSKIMQKMAKYQINHLNIFSGFFLPYLGKKDRAKLRELKFKYKNSKNLNKKIKGKKIKVNLAILGGGDVVFPIIAAGVFLKYSGLGHAILIILGALLGLSYLFFFAEKKKFYPAMPFITIGMFFGAILGYLIL